jgi:hypothetical protein
MHSLYVCLFSSGHIKVGRSINPVQRIEQHRDRVACMGVGLVESHIAECPDDDEGREQSLINKCVQHATARFQLEWFDGLNFTEVCRWADEAARAEFFGPNTANETRWTRLLADLRSAGWSRAALGAHCNVGAMTISRLATGQQEEPMHSVGEKLIALHQRVQASDGRVVGTDESGFSLLDSHALKHAQPSHSTPLN